MNPPAHLGIKVDEDQEREEEEEERGELVEREALAEYSVEVSVKCVVSYHTLGRILSSIRAQNAESCR